jgi:hypothetical protein
MNTQTEIEEPSDTNLRKCGHFRLGQLHRKKGLPCMSANGAYLDGWYEPHKEIPPWITREQMEAFNI